MYKLIKPLQPSGKMEVTPEQSEALQRELFKMGYVVKFKNYSKGKFVFWYNMNKVVTTISEINITYFKEHQNPLQTFTDHFEPLNQKQP
jgi:hypothetical protein